MKNIVIIGGGFGGVYAARRLLKLFRNNPGVHITMVNNTNYFLFIPMLHEVATGSLTAGNIAEPLREILRGKNFSLLREHALSVDFKKKKVKTESMVLPYDYLILATGSTINFFNTPGAEHCLTLKNEEDAHALKNHLITSLEHSFCAQSEKEKQMSATVAVIGAGPTGIELSLEIKEFIDQLLKSNAANTIRSHVYLIHAGDVVLPQFPQLQKPAMNALQNHGIELLLNSRVTKVNQHSVVIADKMIDAATIVWAAGVRPHTFETIPKVVDGRGCFAVDKYLQLQPHVFAIGDCASCVPVGQAKPLPMLAQVASRQGKHAAMNIYLDYSCKQMKPFVYHVRGILLSLGKRKGAGVVFGLPVRGFIAWWLMRTIYLFKIIGTVNKLKTAYEWTLDLFVKRDTTEV